MAQDIDEIAKRVVQEWGGRATAHVFLSAEGMTNEERSSLCGALEDRLVELVPGCSIEVYPDGPGRITASKRP